MDLLELLLHIYVSFNSIVYIYSIHWHIYELETDIKNQHTHFGHPIEATTNFPHWFQRRGLIESYDTELNCTISQTSTVPFKRISVPD